MEVSYTPDALKDRDFWKKSGNRSILKKITALVEAIEDNPFEGIGKPEQLKHELSSYWSRRINKEHRIVYEVFEEENKILILSLKGHYW
ncbi:MAG: Txe/YoeB family addiction module toxin [Vicingaceae bacterium]